MFRTGILPPGNPGRFHKSASLALFAVALFLFGTIASGQSKEAMHARMLDLARQMDAMKPSLASNPVNAFAWSQLMDEYRQLSQSMGGDDPGKALPGGQAANGPSAPSGGTTAPQGCGIFSLTFSNTTDLAVPTGPAVVTSQIVVADAGPYLWDLNVRTTLAHTFAADLDITLTSPAGTVVTLTTDNGSGNDNVFNGTIWDDQANPAGQVPYVSNNGVATDHAYVNLTLASPLVPEEAMSAFRGENPNGVWTLTISDDLAGDGGTLDEWTLFLDVFSSGPRGTTYVFSQNTPVAIPTGPAVVTSDRTVTIPATVCGIRVATALTHTFAADLDITLMSPSGTVATLTTDNGAGNDNVFNGTDWYDDANPAGQVPYVTNNGVTTDHAYVNLTAATPLVPEEAMGAFLGEDAAGTWTITISDDLAGDGGSLDSWDLLLTACSCTNTSRVRRADARASGGASNQNNVAEPNERFMWDPSARNTGPAFGENFDFVYRPQIPLAWTETLQTGQASDVAWSTVNSASSSPPNAAFAPEPSHITDNYLDTPNWPVTDASFFLDITHRYNLEDGFDGGVLEISVNGGAFQDIITAGGGFFGPGYDGAISVNFGSPIGGRQAFTGNSGGFLRTLAVLPASAVGQNVVFRFRAASDSSVSGQGWWIDNIGLGGIASATISGVIGFSGPVGPTYTVHDNFADYGVIPPAAANNCFNATGDCYELEVSGARPTLHWDASVAERWNTGNLFSGIPLHIGASFADVSLISGFYRFIEILLHHGVTSGCGGGNYCPTLDIPREQMAVFLLVSKFGAGYTPPPCVAPVFNDVPCTHPFAAWINELNAQGITSGCGGGNFCPSGPVIREHMAVFLLVSAEGTGYVPAACTTQMFADVPCASPFSRWVNELARRGITSGCGGGNFCPALNVTREQMAVFLAVTFNFDLY